MALGLNNECCTESTLSGLYILKGDATVAKSNAAAVESDAAAERLVGSLLASGGKSTTSQSDSLEEDFNLNILAIRGEEFCEVDG